MRSRTAQWFECKIKYEKVMDKFYEHGLNGLETAQ